MEDQIGSYFSLDLRFSSLNSNPDSCSNHEDFSSVDNDQEDAPPLATTVLVRGHVDGCSDGPSDGVIICTGDRVRVDVVV